MKPKIVKLIVASAVLAALLDVSPCLAISKEDPLAAAMQNELGVKALNEGDTEAAVYYFEQAHRLKPSDKTIKKNLAAAYYERGAAEFAKHNLRYARRYLEGALKQDPGNVNALVLLGDLKYFSQEMDEAKELWKKAIALDPSYKYVGDLKEKIAKLDKEAEIEKNYRSSGMDQFDIRYSQEGARLSYNVRYYLQEAYRLLGQDFNLYPNYRITVVIYKKDDFKSAGKWEEGTMGIYDGKIRLPFIGADLASNQIRSIVWHEYTHLIVYDLTNGRAPLWLNEGLAYYEGAVYAKQDISLLKQAVEKGTLINFNRLDAALSTPSDEKQYSLACQEVYTLAKYLMRRYNKYEVRKLLERLGNGETFEAALKHNLNISLAEFEKRWLRELKAGKLY